MRQSEPVLVVGGGIAGVAAARELAAAGVAVRICDRGHRIGGRMASRTVEGRPVDIGASYFTAADPDFERVVADWQERGLAREWTDTFAVFGDPEKSETSGPMRWAAPGGLRSLVEDLAAGLEVTRQTVGRVEPGRTVDGVAYAAVVLAMPDPQARRLLMQPARGDDPPETPRTSRGTAYAAVLDALDDPYEPVLALTVAWSERRWDMPDGAFVNGDEILAWVADDGRRRGDDAPVLVAHSTAGFAARHLEDPAAAERPMVDALRRVLSINRTPAYAQVQRWSFARPTGSREEPFHLGADLIGVCGDGWHGKPRVEGAYLSGRALGRTLAGRLG